MEIGPLRRVVSLVVASFSFCLVGYLFCSQGTARVFQLLVGSVGSVPPIRNFLTARRAEKTLKLRLWPFEGQLVCLKIGGPPKCAVSFLVSLSSSGAGPIGHTPRGGCPGEHGHCQGRWVLDRHVGWGWGGDGQGSLQRSLRGFNHHLTF